MKGAPLHFIVDNKSQNNLISPELVKRLKFPTTLHPQPYNNGWLILEQDLFVSQQCHLPYAIKPFKDELLCDITSLNVCDVLLGQPYMWKRHTMYESQPHRVNITLGKQLYKKLEVAPKASVSLISAKQCRKVITHTDKYIIFMIHYQAKQKIAATSLTSAQGLTT